MQLALEMGWNANTCLFVQFSLSEAVAFPISPLAWSLCILQVPISGLFTLSLPLLYECKTIALNKQSESIEKLLERTFLISGLRRRTNWMRLFGWDSLRFDIGLRVYCDDVVKSSNGLKGDTFYCVKGEKDHRAQSALRHNLQENSSSSRRCSILISKILFGHVIREGEHLEICIKSRDQMFLSEMQWSAREPFN